jgi:hypothetical protein
MAIVGHDVGDVGSFFGSIKKLARKAVHAGVQAIPGGSVVDAVAGGAIDKGLDAAGGAISGGGGGKKHGKAAYTFTGYKKQRSSGNVMLWVAKLKGPKGPETWTLARLLQNYDQVKGAPAITELQRRLGQASKPHDVAPPPAAAQVAPESTPFYKSPWFWLAAAGGAAALAKSAGGKRH